MPNWDSRNRSAMNSAEIAAAYLDDREDELLDAVGTAPALQRTGGNLEMTVVPTREREFESLSSDRSAAGEKPGLSRIRRVVIQQP